MGQKVKKNSYVFKNTETKKQALLADVVEKPVLAHFLLAHPINNYYYLCQEDFIVVVVSVFVSH